MAAPEAEVSGFGGRYRCDFRCRTVTDNFTGQVVEPERDGSYVLIHPDESDDAFAIGRCLTRHEIHVLAFGRPTVGGFSITEGRTVYDDSGRKATVVGKPVGYSHVHHEKDAVRIDGSLVLVDALYAHAGRANP